MRKLKIHGETNFFTVHTITLICVALVCIMNIFVCEFFDIPDDQLLNIQLCRQNSGIGGASPVTKYDIMNANLFNTGLLFLSSGVYSGLVFRHNILKSNFYQTYSYTLNNDIWSLKTFVFRICFGLCCCVPFFLVSKPMQDNISEVHPVLFMLLGSGLPCYILAFLFFGGFMQLSYIKIFEQNINKPV